MYVIFRYKMNQLVTIQYLRAVAALMVVIHHARNPAVWLFNPLENYDAFSYGVDVFFVISGFIMFVAARDEACYDFLKKRVIRVAPLYWIATVLFVVISTRLNPWPILFENFGHIMKSLLFIPHFSPSVPEKIWPYLIPGWTLNYEMFFYLIFFCGLVVKKPIVVTNFVIGMLFLMGCLMHFEGAFFATYTDPIMLEFLAGIWIGYLHTRFKLSGWFGFSIIFGFLGLFLLPIIGNGYAVERLLYSSFIVLGAVSVCNISPYNNILNILGNASYSIYLTHGVISLGVSSRLWRLMPVEGWLQFLGWIFFSLFISAAVGVLFHIYIEKPLLDWLLSKPRKTTASLVL